MQTYVCVLKDPGHLVEKLLSYTGAPVCWEGRLTNIISNYKGEVIIVVF